MKILVVALVVPIGGLLFFSIIFSGGTKYLLFEAKAHLTPDHVIAQYTCAGGIQLKLINHTYAIPGNTLETNLAPELKTEDYLHVYQGNDEVLNFYLDLDAGTMGITGPLHFVSTDYSKRANRTDSEQFFASTKLCLSEAAKQVMVLQPFYNAMQKYLPNNVWPPQ